MLKIIDIKQVVCCLVCVIDSSIGLLYPFLKYPLVLHDCIMPFYDTSADFQLTMFDL